MKKVNSISALWSAHPLNHAVSSSVSVISNYNEFCIHNLTFSSSVLCTGELDNGPSESTAPVQLLHTSFITLGDNVKLTNC